jgi:hypothetical protein
MNPFSMLFTGKLGSLAEAQSNNRGSCLIFAPEPEGHAHVRSDCHRIIRDRLRDARAIARSRRHRAGSAHSTSEHGTDSPDQRREGKGMVSRLSSDPNGWNEGKRIRARTESSSMAVRSAER